MADYRTNIEMKSYLFSAIEKDIIENFLMKENIESALKTGVNKYSWYWSTEINDDIGEYSALTVNIFEINPATRHADQVPIMKVIPVDKFGRIVQTSDQRKKYAERMARLQKMEIKMQQQGIKLKAEKSQMEKTPNFAPLTDPDILEMMRGEE